MKEPSGRLSPADQPAPGAGRSRLPSGHLPVRRPFAQPIFHIQQFLGFAFHQPRDWDVGSARNDLGGSPRHPLPLLVGCLPGFVFPSCGVPHQPVSFPIPVESHTVGERLFPDRSAVRRVDLLMCLIDLLFGRTYLRNGLFLGLPARLKLVRFFFQVGQLFFDVLKPLF